jgi:hypothetical protein
MGASAGGLAAFKAFFAALPVDPAPGMAFVLVQHLSPDHVSLMAELLQRGTHLRVVQAEDGMPVQINCVYVSPPNRDMALCAGCLVLTLPTATRAKRMPIDFFFDSLAREQHENAIGIVLSGTGSDGTLGVVAIKDAGGLVMVQAPHACEFDNMSTSALATHRVDFSLWPHDMPRQLMDSLGIQPSRADLGQTAASSSAAKPANRTHYVQSSGPEPLPTLRELTEQTLLQQVAPVGALVNSQGDILYMHGRSGMFLEPTPGVSGTNNIVKMARAGLGQELADSLDEVVKTQMPVSTLGLKVKTDGHYTPVDLTVCPVVATPPATLLKPLYLVILENAAAPKPIDDPVKPAP